MDSAGTVQKGTFDEAVTNSVINGPDLPFTWTTPDYSVAFGNEYTMIVSADVYAQTTLIGLGTDPFSLEATADRSHTIRWAGSQGFLGKGHSNVAPGFSAYGNGFNWAQPVPEPPSLVGVAAMLTGFIFRKRKALVDLDKKRE